jgi:hypothetical protein
MQIAVVSDTHGQIEQIREAIRVLDSLNIDAIIHCGDIGSTAVIPLFEKWPTHFVFGNVDRHDEAQLQTEIEACGQTCHGRFGELSLAGQKIAFLHSDDRNRFLETMNSGEWDLVCYGHTHRVESHTVGETVILNPRALHRATPRSFALVELPSRKISSITL